MRRRGFTLIELLVVIAIIAVLAVIIILVLNPAELLKQARDARRLSDVSTLSEAVALYVSDNSAASLGTASTTNISIPDPNATSTAGDQCNGLNLPVLTAGSNYQCAASSTAVIPDSTGWIPLNFNAISSGSPLDRIPIDPVNQTSSNYYYTYTGNGSQYEVTAVVESAKYKTVYGTSPQIKNYPGLLAQGSSLSLSALWNPAGLMGYWNLDEGSGGIATDSSGNNHNGTWAGTPIGSGATYYTAGKIGTYAGLFNGGNNAVNAGSNVNDFKVTTTTSITDMAWVNLSAVTTTYQSIITYSRNSGNFHGIWINNADKANFAITNVVNLTSPASISANQWHLIAGVQIGSQGDYLYVDGNLVASGTTPSVGNGVGNALIGEDVFPDAFNGAIDDARIYSRALSTAEIQALYNSGR